MHTYFRCFNQNGNVFLLFFPNCPGADAETEEKRGTEECWCSQKAVRSVIELRHPCRHWSEPWTWLAWRERWRGDGFLEIEERGLTREVSAITHMLNS